MSSRTLSFALTTALAAFALAVLSPALLNDGDTWWHIRSGQWMLAHHAVLRVDVFSYTVTGQPWHAAEWLSEIIMALGFAGGWAGEHLLFGFAAALAAGVVAGFVRQRMDFIPAVLVTVMGLSCVTGSLLARPHMLALPLLAIWTAGLVTARERGRAPSWWLIAVMPLWANLHGSFAFGLALAGALAVEAAIEDRRQALGWSLFMAVAIASALLTPFGVSGLLFPFKLSAMHGLAHIGEWEPSDFSTLSPFAIALLASLFLLGRGQVKVPPLRILIVVGLVGLALLHGRHQMLVGICAPLLLAPALGQAWPAKHERGKPAFALMAAFGFLAVIAARLAMPVVRGDDPVSPMTALAHVPRFVRETPVLNGYEFGGYLIWSGVPSFIDSRADLYGDIFLQNYAAITAPDKDALAGALTYYHVRWTIFPAGAPVVKLLDDMPGWHRYYQDKVAVVHIHD